MTQQRCDNCGFTLAWHFIRRVRRNRKVTYEAICPVRQERQVVKSHRQYNPMYTFLRRYSQPQTIEVVDEVQVWNVANLRHCIDGRGRGYLTWITDAPKAQGFCPEAIKLVGETMR